MCCCGPTQRENFPSTSAAPRKATVSIPKSEHPKLGAVATLSMSRDDYAGMLDRALERSGKTAEVRQIDPSHRLLLEKKDIGFANQF